MKKVFYFFTAFLFSVISSGQNNIESLIPAKASKIKVFNGEKIAQYVELDSLLSDNESEYLYEKIADPEKNSLSFMPKALLKDIRNWGINPNKNYYYYSYRTDSSSITGYLFQLAEPTQLSGQLAKCFPKELMDKQDKRVKFNFLAKESYVLFWNHQFIGLINANLDYSYLRNDLLGEGDYYIEDLKESERDKRDLQRSDLKQKYAVSFLEKLFDQDFDQSIVSNEKFMSMLSKNNFISTYQQMSENIFPFPLNMGSRYPSSYNNYKKEAKENEKFKNYSVTHIDLNASGIDKQVALYLNPSYMDEIEKTFKAKQDKKLLKYVDASNLTGFMCATVNTPNLFKTIRMIQKDMGANSGPMDFRGIQQFSSSLMFELMDEKKLKKLLPGKMIMAYTGKQEMDVKYLNYEYLENGSSKRIIETKKEAMPEFVLAISLGNDMAVNKLISNLSSGELLQDMGGYYKMKQRNSFSRYGNNKGKTDTYLRYIDGVLLISNDEKLLSEEAPEGGVAKEKRLSGANLKNFKSHPFYAEMDLIAYKEYKGGISNRILPTPFETKIYSYQKISGPTFSGDKMSFKTELRSISSKNEIYESLISDILFSFDYSSERLYESPY